MGREKTKPHTILFFSSFGSMQGGGQRSLLYLVRGLDKKLFHPVVVCSEDGELVAKLKENGIETLLVPHKRLRYLSVAHVFRLLKLFRKLNVALIDTDAPTETFYAGIAARLIGIPLIWHIRVSNASLLDRLLCLLSTKLILVAKSLENRFPYLDAGKLAPIINGISLTEFDGIPRTNIRKEFGIDDDAVIVGCIGRIEEMKGQEYLVRAAEIVSEKTGTIHLLLVGAADEEYLRKIKNIIHSFQPPIPVSFPGYRTDASGMIKNIDIIVSASSFGEGLSRIILEAMAAGKPVIATAIGGAGEAVADGLTGYVIPPRDHVAMADVILKLATNSKQRNEMGRKGRQRVEQNFALADNIRKTERLFLEIIASDH